MLLKIKMYKICFLVFYLSSLSESKNILAVIPTPSISHQVVFRPLLQALIERGHEVTTITTDPEYPKEKCPQNLTEINVHDISYNIWKKYVEGTNKGTTDSLFEQIKTGYSLLSLIFEAQVKTPEVQKLLSNKGKTFDLIIIEHITRLALSFSYVYDAPVIEISSMGGLIGTCESVGASSHPLIYPMSFLKGFHNFSIWDKLSQIHLYFKYYSFYKTLEISENIILKRLFGPNIPDLDDLKKKSHILFLNVHPIWDLNRPVPPNVVYLGGIHQRPPKELPKDLENYLESTINGVIYVSFGTNVKPSLLPVNKLKIFINVFSQLPYDVLWKWDKNELPDCPKNVKTAKWYPQSDLLRHPKIKLFITQGGLQSTDEAITAGVPLIGIPMLADQWINVDHYVKNNIGLKLDLETITEKTLLEAINTIVNNMSYRDNVLKLRTIMYDQPLSPLERAVWWTEYVLRHKGASHLKANGMHLDWSEYYELKLLLSIALLLFISFLMLCLTAYYCSVKLKRNINLKVKNN